MKDLVSSHHTSKLVRYVIKGESRVALRLVWEKLQETDQKNRTDLVALINCHTVRKVGNEKNKQKAHSSEQNPGDRQIAAQESPANLSYHVSLLAFLWKNSRGWKWDLSLSPSHLLIVQIPAVDKIIATLFRYKNTFLQSSSLPNSSSVSFVTNPILLLDLKTLRTEVGFKGISYSSMWITEQQQHADISCVWSSSPVLFTMEQSSRRGRDNALPVPVSPPPLWL